MVHVITRGLHIIINTSEIFQNNNNNNNISLGRDF